MARVVLLAATLIFLAQNALAAAGQPSSDKAAGLASLLASVSGTSNLHCYPDAACAPLAWEPATRAVVLLLLGNSRGARFCTGALLNTPHLWAAAAASGIQPSTYILTATHCRQFDTDEDAGTYYTAVFQHQAGSCSAGTAAGRGGATVSTSKSGIGIAQATAAAASPRRRGRRLLGAADSGSRGGAEAGKPPIAPSSAVLTTPSVLPQGPATGAPMHLQGLHVAWQDEDTDVLLLRLDGAVPAEFRAAYLGWNASSWASVPTPVGTLSHPRGDLAKYSFSDGGLQRARFVPVPESGGPGGGGDSDKGGSTGGTAATHYKLTWTEGGTDTGSSGAPLIDAATQQVLGVLTGGEAATCGNMDLFGSLHAAWLRGLWEVLSPGGPAAVTSMPLASQRGEQGDMAGALPGLVVSPASLVLQGGGGTGEKLRVRLSAPPAAGMQLSVAVSVQLTQLQPLLQQLSSGTLGMAGMAPADMAPAGMAPELAAITLSTTSLLFDSTNWAEERIVVVGLGPADRLVKPPATFTILLSAAAASSLGNTGGGGSTVAGTAAAGSPATGAGIPGPQPLLLSIPVRRLDDTVLAGDSQEQPILVTATDSLDLAASGKLLLPPPDGTLVPAVPAVQAAQEAAAAAAAVLVPRPAGSSLVPASPAVQAAAAAQAVYVGQPLEGLGSATGRRGLGGIQYYSLSTSGAVSLNVTACSTDAPLQVAVFNAGVATWVSTERNCTGSSAGAGAGASTGRDTGADPGGCRGLSGVGGCSGFQRLPLPGLDGGAPYILAVLLLPVAAASDSSEASPSSGSAGGAIPSAPASVSYDLQLKSTARPPTFAQLTDTD